MEKWFGELNAIAHGVHAIQELRTRHSSVITQETVAVARQLGIPGEPIQRWVATRQTLDDEKGRAITSLIEKIARSPLTSGAGR